ncbi:MAG: hypothetical protein WAK95_08290 [Desulfobacterales bacterium]
MKKPICHCFQYTAEDVRQDFLRNGRSLIMEKIQATKRLGGCHCSVNHPQGR